MLSTNVKSTSDLMSIALQAEREAIRRYTELSETMQKADNKSAAFLFKRLITEELEHESLLLKWMSKEGITINPDIGPISWHDPHVSTAYNDDARDPSYSTPYRALAFAVHNEEIAFRFYTHVAANTDNKDMRDHAETLAREELSHAALLRAERRLAYHAEHKGNTGKQKLDPETICSDIDLLTTALHIDNFLLDKTRSINSASSQLEALAALIQKQIMTNQLTLNKLINEKNETAGSDIESGIEIMSILNNSSIENSKQTELSAEKLLDIFDHVFSFFDNIVETTDNECIMLTAQEQTSEALDRISILKQLIST